MSALPPIESATQRIVSFREFGSPEVLEVLECSVPEPGPGEVRIRVEAASVQFTDTLIRRGLYPDLKDRPPLTPGYDLVGRVDGLGPGVHEVAVGDRVADLTTIGGNARYAIRPAVGLVPVPESVDTAEAVALVLSWVTAHQALFRTAELKPGERVLIVGGNGAVGQAAIALAVRAGAEVHTTASERHHAQLFSQGANPLPRNQWAEATTGGFDVVLDGIAENGFWHSYRSLRRGGRLVGTGASSAAATGSMLKAIWSFFCLLVVFPLIPDGRKARRYSITLERSRHPEQFCEDLEQLIRLLEQGAIQPGIERRIGIEEVAETHRRLESGGMRGKVILIP